ncbi:MAG TPA: GNAT family N-acetyltransferase [Dongiaceae bacterium]|nr:GNAT family N-acetyltransferase [Dongiaceae bacterium]
MAIRPAHDGDYAAIARLRRQTIRHVNARDYSDEVIRRWSVKETATTLLAGADLYRRWVAIERGRMVGFCEHDRQGALSRLYVHKDHLRKGIGSRLLASAEASLKALGFAEVTLEATITARDFYAANGYKLIRRASRQGDRSEPVYLMRKRF